jgi:transposase
MTRRYELTDEGFVLIADLLPATDQAGGRWSDHRTILNGILWALHTGAQWREVPERYGPWGTVYGRFRRWRADGTFDRILARLHLELNDRGLIDNDLWCVDATSIRASRAAGGAGGGKGRRGAGGPRPGAIARRIRDQAPPRRRRPRHPPVRGRHGRPGARVEVAGARPGGGAAPAPPARPPAPSAATPGRRQGVQLPPHPPLPAAARDQGGDPDPQGSAPRPAVRQGDLPAAQRRRAVRPVAEGVPAIGDPLREARCQLPGDGQARHDPEMYAYP